MSDAALAIRQVRYENKAFWRNPPAAFFTFAFPLIFLVIFNLIFGSGTTPRFDNLREVSISTFYIPAIAAFSIITANYTNIAIGVVFAREEGVLKRMRGTPLPSWIYLFGRVAHAVLIGFLLIVIVVVFGRLFYDVELPGRTLPAFIAAIAVGSATFAALGLAISPLAKTAEAAPALTNVTILPLLFISDVFIPLDQAPEWLGTVSSIFPVKHLSNALINSYDPFATDSIPKDLSGDLIVMGVWGLAGLLLAVRFFSWEPHV